ncbi:hypothetical protein DP939_32755 [Spongiactinospora rosea]|uniref:Uncharacterized protein n=1 Tax=Spongiactinospora rosea TaxID=2248750 RepID=A0A366LQ59_9ACTN|nr:hypothetical protein [Spongiactinospora rosea]RBQ16075.1 hypothetical protein DP939_32755 [Spongiactinospora rosea]
MERRRLIQAAALGVGLTAMENQERVRQLLALSDEGRSVEDWERTCGNLRQRLCTQPVGKVREAIGVELDALLRERQRASPARIEDLLRIQAALAALYANALGRLSEHEASLRWWRTARQAADASKDQSLAVGIRGTEAGNALYGQRSPGVVLELTQAARGLADGVPSWGLVYVLCAQARAAAVLQRHDEAMAALRQAETLVGGAELPVPSVMPSYWNDACPTEWTASLVYATVGDESRSAQARTTVFGHKDYQYRAAARLHGALATVANGGIAEGLAAAMEIIDGVAPGHRTNTVTYTARLVLQAVPPEQRTSPAAADLRAVLGER